MTSPSSSSSSSSSLAPAMAAATAYANRFRDGLQDWVVHNPEEEEEEPEEVAGCCGTRPEPETQQAARFNMTNNADVAASTTKNNTNETPPPPELQLTTTEEEEVYYENDDDDDDSVSSSTELQALLVPLSSNETTTTATTATTARTTTTRRLDDDSLGQLLIRYIHFKFGRKVNEFKNYYDTTTKYYGKTHSCTPLMEAICGLNFSHSHSDSEESKARIYVLLELYPKYVNYDPPRNNNNNDQQLLQCAKKQNALLLDINAKNTDGETALNLAAYFGMPCVVKYLIDHGADVNGGKVSPLHMVASASCFHPLEPKKYELVTKILIENGADVNGTLHGDGFCTPLIVASCCGNYQVACALLDSGSKVGLDHLNEYGETLLSAILSLWYNGNDLRKQNYSGQVKIVEKLIKNGASNRFFMLNQANYDHEYSCTADPNKAIHHNGKVSEAVCNIEEGRLRLIPIDMEGGRGDFFWLAFYSITSAEWISLLRDAPWEDLGYLGNWAFFDV